MSKVLVLHNADADEAMIATALVRRFVKDGHDVTIAGDGITQNIMRLAGFRCENGFHTDVVYDVAVNLSPSYSCTEAMSKSVQADEKLGYGQDESGLFFYNEGAHHHYRAKYVRIPTGANQFQLLFGLAGLKWQGEGYCLKYFPRTRSKKTLTGVAIKDQNLKQFILGNLHLDCTRLWRVPIRQNVSKQIDEINRCKQIVTDDLTVAHAALALRKVVEFLTPKSLPYRFEMFGAGSVHLYDPKVIKK